mmetsp:Transcript_118921/g.296719  ORF Transcript_118921/g.296719 Transcript_118921/m.296719 type:complete len:233 (+) Transcript_118921:696-1394(+)
MPPRTVPGIEPAPRTWQGVPNCRLKGCPRACPAHRERACRPRDAETNGGVRSKTSPLQPRPPTAHPRVEIRWTSHPACTSIAAKPRRRLQRRLANPTRSAHAAPGSRSVAIGKCLATRRWMQPRACLLPRLQRSWTLRGWRCSPRIGRRRVHTAVHLLQALVHCVGCSRVEEDRRRSPYRSHLSLAMHGPAAAACALPCRAWMLGRTALAIQARRSCEGAGRTSAPNAGGPR